MANGLRANNGAVAAPPYTRGPYTWSEDLTLSGDLAIGGDLTVSGTFAYGAVTATSFVNTGTTQLGDASADTVTIYGNTTTNAAQNPTFNWQGTGNFTTSTGVVTLAGDVTIAAGKDIGMSGAATFTTGTGLTDINGDCEIAGDLAVTGALTAASITYTDLTITGDLEVQGDDINKTKGTLNLSKSGSMTTVKGTLNVDEATTFDTTLGVTGITTLSGALVAAGASDFRGNLTATSGNPSFNWSGSNSTFQTSSGTHTINGDVNIAANKDIVLVAGTGYIQSVDNQFTNIKALDGTTFCGIADSTGHALVNTNKRIQFHDTGQFIHAPADAQLLVQTDGTLGLAATTSITATSAAINLVGSVAVTAANTFTTGTGAVSILGDATCGTSKKIQFHDAGQFIHAPADGQLLVQTDGTLGLTATTSATITSADIQVAGPVTITAANTLTTGTGDTTISGNLVLSGHKNGQVFNVNGFTYPNPAADWTPHAFGARILHNQAAKLLYIPLNFLKRGDEIVSYNLVGDVTKVGGVTTLDCKLVMVNKADPCTTSDVAGGGIVQVDADGNFDVLATLGAVEVVATDKQYYLLVTATASDNAGNIIDVMGAEVVINRK